MFTLIGKAAQAAGRGWALFTDEVQYLADEELAAIIVAVHRVSQKNLPVVVVAAGLPQIAKLSGAQFPQYSVKKQAVIVTPLAPVAF